MRDGISSGRTVIHPYWIPAVLDRSGVFYPPENDNDIPWLVRGVLEPNDYMSCDLPVLTSVERVDEIGTTFQIPRDNWDSYFSGALYYFRKQVGSDINNLNVNGWTVNSEQYAIIPGTLSGITAPLIRFYDYYLEQSDKLLPGTLESLLSLRRSMPEAIEDPELFVADSCHYGQMADQFPLSHSQRISLAMLNKTELNQVMACNGPPGTGKTTLIQSVVADLLVKSFVDEERPPLIIGSSANNKAITNILDSFASVTPGEDFRTGLNERWLPELTVLGHYLTANSAEKLEAARNSGYWVSTASSKGTDSYSDYCEAHSQAECENYFIEKFRSLQNISQIGDLKSCYEIIKEKTSSLRIKIDTIIESIKSVRAFITEYNLDIISISNLDNYIESQISSLREKRIFLDGIIDKEQIVPKRPSFFLRWIEQIRFGNPEIRRVRLQSELMQQADLSIDLELPDWYDLAEEVWKKRETIFKTEIGLSKTWESIKFQYTELFPYLSKLDNNLSCNSTDWVEAIQGLLDVGPRHEAFWWALHGLECKWLIQRNDNNYRELNHGKEQSIQRWRERSFLTPVFVSTFHSLPNFFSYRYKSNLEWVRMPLTECVDLLIIDEAGQVAPEIGVPVFGIAKKALLVGDVQQLEPIWNIPSAAIDFSNLKRSGIVDQTTDYEGFALSRRSSLNGSLMVLAQDASSYLYPPQWEEAGALLVEHRRCAPAIIEYCNRYVYKSLLEVKTNTKNAEWPALGYCHIGGESRKYRSSQSNPIEAKSIASWIRKNKKALIEKYVKKDGSSLADVIAIVTPFRGQQFEIIQALKDIELYEKEMVVGTVHSLQGAEKPVVIFSPVYGRNHQGCSLFFNQSYNMLNVAISRAKEHFFVFGNMSLFKENQSNSPAGDLGHLLFLKPENEIANDFIFTEPQIELFEQEPVDRISDLDKHCLALKKAFKKADNRLVIVSPFISNAALKADNIPDLVSEAVQRNVEVIIITDANLDRSHGSLKPHAKEGRQALQDAGATLKIMDGIHNKTVLIDRSILIEGSFNWLSAVRDESSPYHRHETSIVVKAPHCERFIIKVEGELGLSSEKL